MVSVARCESGDLLEGHLSVRLSDPNGFDLPAGVFTVRTESGDVVYHASAHRAVELDLPYGRYEIAFDSDFTIPASRAVVIDQRTRFVTLAAAFDVHNLHLTDDQVAISVRVGAAKTCTGGSRIWVKLAGLFTTYMAEQQMSAGGYALFERVPVGTYIVVVVDGQSARAFKSVRTSGPVTTITMPLSPCGR